LKLAHLPPTSCILPPARPANTYGLWNGITTEMPRAMAVSPKDESVLIPCQIISNQNGLVLLQAARGRFRKYLTVQYQCFMLSFVLLVMLLRNCIEELNYCPANVSERVENTVVPGKNEHVVGVKSPQYPFASDMLSTQHIFPQHLRSYSTRLLSFSV